MPNVAEMLAEARSRIERVDPRETLDAVRAGDAVLLDIRSDEQRARDGVVPEAVRVARNVLEWRCDPTCEDRDERVSDPAKRVVVMCDAGWASSLAAVTLQELGLPRATDLAGGFQAWRAAGLPVEPLRG